MLQPLPSPAIFPDGSAHHSVAWSLQTFDESWFQREGICVPEALLKAVPKRRAEFLAGRYCADQSLRLFGAHGGAPLAANPDRSPVWPAGFVGSITHTGTYAAAVVARASSCRGIGIDTENIVEGNTADRLKGLIMTPEELESLQRVESALSFAQIFTLVFSAKESLYKCLRPIVGTFFGFHSASCVELRCHSEVQGTLTLSLDENFAPDKGFPRLWCARWLLESDCAHTCVSLLQFKR